MRVEIVFRLSLIVSKIYTTDTSSVTSSDYLTMEYNRRRLRAKRTMYKKI